MLLKAPIIEKWKNKGFIFSSAGIEAWEHHGWMWSVCTHACVGVIYRAWIWIRLIQTREQSHHVEPVLLQSDLHPRGLTVITSAFIGNNLRNRRADWLDKSETLCHSLSDHTHTHRLDTARAAGPEPSAPSSMQSKMKTTQTADGRSSWGV